MSCSHEWAWAKDPDPSHIELVGGARQSTAERIGARDYRVGGKLSNRENHAISEAAEAWILSIFGCQRIGAQGKPDDGVDMWLGRFSCNVKRRDFVARDRYLIVPNKPKFQKTHHDLKCNIYIGVSGLSTSEFEWFGWAWGGEFFWPENPPQIFGPKGRPTRAIHESKLHTTASLLSWATWWRPRFRKPVWCWKCGARRKDKNRAEAVFLGRGMKPAAGVAAPPKSLPSRRGVVVGTISAPAGQRRGGMDAGGAASQYCDEEPRS